jgi:hypothetical protein
VFIEGIASLARRIVGDDRLGALLGKKAPQPVAVIGGVACQAAARRDRADQRRGDANVAQLARRYFEGDRASAGIDDRMDFRGAAAARAADRLRIGPPFPPAAERCALAVVLSMAWTSPGSIRIRASNNRRHNLRILQRRSDCRQWWRAHKRPGNPASDSRPSEHE